MANIPVGDEGCTYHEVLILFENAKIKAVINTEWTKLCGYLETPHHLINNQKRDIVLKLSTTLDVLGTILIEWRSRKSSEATLGALLRFVILIGGWTFLEEELQKLIISKAKTFDELDERSKVYSSNRTFSYQGNEVTLLSLKGSKPADEFHKVVNILQTNHFRDFLEGKPVSFGSPEAPAAQ